MRKLLLSLAMLLSSNGHAQTFDPRRDMYVHYGAESVIRTPNASPTGTTLNKLATLTGAPSAAVITAAGATSTIGVVIADAGTTGTASIATAGILSIEFDGATTAGDGVTYSTTVAGDAQDTGQPGPGPLGTVLSTNASAGTYLVDFQINGGIPYFLTKGGGFTINVGPSLPSKTVMCNGTDVTYAGGTVTASASVTGYVYLDPSLSCVPVYSTTIWNQYQVPLGVAVTNGSGVTSLTNVHPWATTRQAPVVAGNSPITVAVSGTPNAPLYTVGCASLGCATGPLSTAKGALVGSATCGISFCSGVGLESVPFFHLASSSVCSSGICDAWPIAGYFRNIVLNALTVPASGNPSDAQLGIDPVVVVASNPTSWTAGLGILINSDTLVGGNASQNASEYWYVGQGGNARFAVDFRGTAATGFTSPGYTVEFVATAGNWSVLGADVENPPSANTTTYGGPYLGAFNDTVEGNYSFPVPTPGNWQYFIVNSNSVGSSNSTQTFKLRKGTGSGAASDTIITATMPITAQPIGVYHDYVNAVHTTASDYIDWRETNTSTAGTISTVNQVRVGFQADDSSLTISGGQIGQTAISTTPQFFRIMGRHSDTTELNEAMDLPRDATIGNLHVYIKTAITAGHTVTLTLRRCPLGTSCVDTPITCGLTNASGTGNVTCDSTHFQAYNRTDAIVLKAVNSTGTDSGLGAFSFTVQ